MENAWYTIVVVISPSTSVICSLHQHCIPETKGENAWVSTSWSTGHDSWSHECLSGYWKTLGKRHLTSATWASCYWQLLPGVQKNHFFTVTNVEYKISWRNSPQQTAVFPTLFGIVCCWGYFLFRAVPVKWIFLWVSNLNSNGGSS